MAYNHTKIRQLLQQIDPLELLQLCYDQPRLWQRLYDVRRHADQPLLDPLLDYVRRHRLHAELLRWAERYYPRLYHRYAPYLENPFLHSRGYLHRPSQLFGREVELRHLRSALKNRQNMALIAPSGLGKSSLLYHLYLTRQQWASEMTVVYVDLQEAWDEADFFFEVLQKLGHTGETHRAFKMAIRRRSLILLFDEVERLADKEFNFKLQGLLRACGQREHFTMGVASKRPLEQVFPDPQGGDTSPFANIFTEIKLAPFAEWEARRFIESRLAASEIRFSEAEMERLLAASGGQPAELQRLARTLFAEKLPPPGGPR